MLEAAIKHLTHLAPSPLPVVTLPPLPDLAPVKPLAEMAHGNPEPLLRAAGLAEEDRRTIAGVLEEGKRLIQAALRDLLGIGAQLLQRGLPLALALLVPNPATQIAARAALHALIMESLGRAIARAIQLGKQLLAAAAPLLPIAQRAIESAVRGAQGHGKHALVDVHHSATHAPAALGPGIGGSGHGSSSHGGAGSSLGLAAVAAAKSKLGAPYVWGGTGSGGFDCSGLTQWAWRQAGVELPRTAETQTVGRQVSAHELQPGDLVVWDGHVAMYSGGGQMIEAGSPVQSNPLRTSNMGMAFKGFWRPTG